MRFRTLLSQFLRIFLPTFDGARINFDRIMSFKLRRYIRDVYCSATGALREPYRHNYHVYLSFSFGFLNLPNMYAVICFGANII